MAETKRAGAHARRHHAAAGAHAEAGRQPDGLTFGDGKKRWWHVLQGTGLSLVESSERPSDQHQPGDPTIRVMGPFPDQDMAKERFEELRSQLHDPSDAITEGGAR